MHKHAAVLCQNLLHNQRQHVCNTPNNNSRDISQCCYPVQVKPLNVQLLLPIAIAIHIEVL
jgi:hypothetical protein